MTRDEFEAYLANKARNREQREAHQKRLDRMASGHEQLGPGMPLLPPAYRGSADFIGLEKLHLVMHEGSPVAAFQSKADAQTWVAWFARERDQDPDGFAVLPVTRMSKRLVGPLFDSAPATPTPKDAEVVS